MITLADSFVYNMGLVIAIIGMVGILIITIKERT